MLSHWSLPLLGGASAVIAAIGGAAAACRSTMAAAEARVATGSSVLATHFGALEYAQAGSGRPLLMVHGAAGGFDQGLACASPLVAAGHRIVAPSRFGYLRSDLPDDPSSENQADAFVELLDALAIEKLPVAGGSAGALSAMQFALRHPNRCSALILIVPVAYVPGRRSAVPMGRRQEIAVKAMLSSDALFWLSLNTATARMIGTLLATDPAVVAAASPDEQARLRKIIWDILPISRRRRGMLNDAVLGGNLMPVPLQDIMAPTLAISVEDDGFDTCQAARHVAAGVEGARLVTYPTGGHAWAGHDTELFAEVDRFVKAAT